MGKRQEEIFREVEDFENKSKSNIEETEEVNLGNSEIVKETRISIHLSPSDKEEYIKFLKEYEDILAWSYDDITGLSTYIVARPQATYQPYVSTGEIETQEIQPRYEFKHKEKRLPSR